jgi:hypothetical protein
VSQGEVEQGEDLLIPQKQAFIPVFDPKDRRNTGVVVGYGTNEDSARWSSQIAEESKVEDPSSPKF